MKTQLLISFLAAVILTACYSKQECRGFETEKAFVDFYPIRSITPTLSFKNELGETVVFELTEETKTEAQIIKCRDKCPCPPAELKLNYYSAELGTNLGFLGFYDEYGSHTNGSHAVVLNDIVYAWGGQDIESTEGIDGFYTLYVHADTILGEVYNHIARIEAYPGLDTMTFWVQKDSGLIAFEWEESTYLSVD